MEHMKQTKDKVLCVSAGSQWYQAGEEYQVYIDHKGVRYVLGSDGYYDQIGKMVSRFKEINSGQGDRSSGKVTKRW